MNSRRNMSALFLVGSLTVWLPTSDAFGATATISDVTDFITRLGGYLFQIAGPAPDTYVYWQQVSYAVKGTPSASNNTSSSNTSSNNTSSNNSTITVTEYPMAAVAKGTGTPVLPPAGPPPALTTATATFLAQLSPCQAQNYIIETVTLDLRDIQLIRDTPASKSLVSENPIVNADGKLIPIVGEDGKPINGEDGKPQQIWSVVLQTNSKADIFMRKNKQTLPANCPPGGVTPDSKMEQQDVGQYPILFADETQAKRFVKLLNNAIPTLNPPVLLVPATP